MALMMIAMMQNDRSEACFFPTFDFHGDNDRALWKSIQTDTMGSDPYFRVMPIIEVTPRTCFCASDLCATAHNYVDHNIQLLCSAENYKPMTFASLRGVKTPDSKDPPGVILGRIVGNIQRRVKSAYTQVTDDCLDTLDIRFGTSIKELGFFRDFVHSIKSWKCLEREGRRGVDLTFDVYSINLTLSCFQDGRTYVQQLVPRFLGADRSFTPCNSSNMTSLCCYSMGPMLVSRKDPLSIPKLGYQLPTRELRGEGGKRMLVPAEFLERFPGFMDFLLPSQSPSSMALCQESVARMKRSQQLILNNPEDVYVEFE